MSDEKTLPEWIFHTDSDNGDGWIIHTVKPRFNAQHAELGNPREDIAVKFCLDETDTHLAFNFRWIDGTPSDAEFLRLESECREAWQKSLAKQHADESFLLFCLAQDLAQWIGWPISCRQDGISEKKGDGSELIYCGIYGYQLDKLAWHINEVKKISYNDDIEIDGWENKPAP